MKLRRAITRDLKRFDAGISVAWKNGKPVKMRRTVHLDEESQTVLSVLYNQNRIARRKAERLGLVANADSSEL